MTPKQRKYKKALIQQVHTSSKYLSYYKDDNDAYREKLLSHFGHSSSKDLSLKQLIVFVKWLNNELPDLPIIKDRSQEATNAQLRLIRTLWSIYARDTTEKALRRFVQRITSNNYLHLESISKEDATKCIVALKNSLKKKEGA